MFGKMTTAKLKIEVKMESGPTKGKRCQLIVITSQLPSVMQPIVKYSHHQRENTGSRLFTKVKPC